MALPTGTRFIHLVPLAIIDRRVGDFVTLTPNKSLLRTPGAEVVEELNLKTRRRRACRWAS